MMPKEAHIPFATYQIVNLHTSQKDVGVAVHAVLADQAQTHALIQQVHFRDQSVFLVAQLAFPTIVTYP
jgi:hypothetical protein